MALIWFAERALMSFFVPFSFKIGIPVSRSVFEFISTKYVQKYNFSYDRSVGLFRVTPNKEILMYSAFTPQLIDFRHMFLPLKAYAELTLDNKVIAIIRIQIGGIIIRFYLLILFTLIAISILSNISTIATVIVVTLGVLAIIFRFFRSVFYSKKQFSLIFSEIEKMYRLYF